MLRMLFISTQVTFFGELSVDAGGPRREFFRLLVHQAADTLLRGEYEEVLFYECACHCGMFHCTKHY